VITTDPIAKQRRGCRFYGCLATSALLAGLLVVAFLGSWHLKKLITNCTDTHPVAVPVAQVSPGQREQLERRLGTFEQAVRLHQPAAPLALSADDLNALIATDPRFEALKGRLYVALEGGAFQGQVSVPLAQAGLQFLKGRYLNGVAGFGFSLNRGALRVWIQDFRVRGKPLPSLLMKQLRKQDLARKFSPDPRVATPLDRVKELQIKDGNLLIVPLP
jgi:hypothetical protein